MAKYHVPIIAEIECASIDDARKAVYKALQTISLEGFRGGDEGAATPIKMVMANDGMKTKTGQRVFLLHPEDVACDYSPDDYEKALEKDED